MIDSEMLGGFCDRLTDGRTDICDCRVAFATENESESMAENFGLFLAAYCVRRTKNIHRYIYATMSMKNFLIMFPSPYQLHAVLVLDDFISKIISLHLVVYSMSILVK